VEKLYLIDPYLMYSDYVEGNKHYDFDQAPLTEAEKTARKLLEPHKDSCVWLKKMSADAARDISEKTGLCIHRGQSSGGICVE